MSTIFPLYVCETCGQYGGVSLSYSQLMAKAMRGEKTDQSNAINVECPDGHGPMRLLGNNDRLKIVEQTP